MTYRDTHTIEQNINTMESLIQRALTADSTRDTVQFAGEAQAAAVGLRDFLEDALRHDAYPDRARADLHAAGDALSRAATTAEKVGLGTDLTSLRERVAQFKTELDSAIQLLRQSLGLLHES